MKFDQSATNRLDSPRENYVRQFVETISSLSPSLSTGSWITNNDSPRYSRQLLQRLPSIMSNKTGNSLRSLSAEPSTRSGSSNMSRAASAGPSQPASTSHASSPAIISERDLIHSELSPATLEAIPPDKGKGIAGGRVGKGVRIASPITKEERVIATSIERSLREPGKVRTTLGPLNAIIDDALLIPGRRNQSPTIYQFLLAWLNHSPWDFGGAQDEPYWVLVESEEDEDEVSPDATFSRDPTLQSQLVMMNPRLKNYLDLALSTLQLALRTGEQLYNPHAIFYVIDRDFRLDDLSRGAEPELARLADFALKIRVRTAFRHLVRIVKLHEGMEVLSPVPTAPESAPNTPDNRSYVHKLFHGKNMIKNVPHKVRDESWNTVKQGTEMHGIGYPFYEGRMQPILADQDTTTSEALGFSGLPVWPEEAQGLGLYFAREAVAPSNVPPGQRVVPVPPIPAPNFENPDGALQVNLNHDYSLDEGTQPAAMSANRLANPSWSTASVIPPSQPQPIDQSNRVHYPPTGAPMTPSSRIAPTWAPPPVTPASNPNRLLTVAATTVAQRHRFIPPAMVPQDWAQGASALPPQSDAFSNRGVLNSYLSAGATTLPGILPGQILNPQANPAPASGFNNHPSSAAPAQIPTAPPIESNDNDPTQNYPNGGPPNAWPTSGGGPSGGGPGGGGPGGNGPSGGGPGGGYPPNGGYPPGGGVPGGGGPGGGYPPGGGPPGGPSGPSTVFPPFGGGGYRPQDFQFDMRVKWTQVKEWDGDYDTAVQWLLDTSHLCTLSADIARDLGRVAPQSFTGQLKNSWYGLSIQTRAIITGSWPLLVEWITTNYLGNTWRMKETLKYKDMRFRQRGHENESPEGYLLRRIQICRIFYDFPENGVQEIASVIQQCPPSWERTLRWHDHPTMEIIQEEARRYKESLISSWREKEAKYREHSYRNDRRANVATTEDADPAANYYDMEEHEEDSQPRTVALATKPARSQDKTSKPRPAKPAEGASAPFPRDDSVVSAKAPPSPCYACGSPRHFNGDCKYWGRFEAQRAAGAKDRKGQAYRAETLQERAAYAALTEELPLPTYLSEVETESFY